jgi:Ca2+-binding RTX toxin-like protein
MLQPDEAATRDGRDHVRRTTLTLVVALVALMVAGGVAFAKTVDGDDGPNNLNGTAQADVIRGYGGNDSISPGDGVDRVYAGRGNDRVSSRSDDSRDVVRCGRGTDTVNEFPGPNLGPPDKYISCETKAQ